MQSNFPAMLSNNEIKKRTGIYAADFVESGMMIGLGTGSTVFFLIEELGKRVQQGLQLTIVPTSHQTETMAKQLNMRIADLNDVDKLQLTIDGADEVDPQLQLIKGGGGALLQEKIVAAASEQLIIIADQSKMVDHLGRFPLPVEVIPFGYKQVERKILSMNCSKVELRQKDNKPFVTDHKHYILDCYFEKINDAAWMNNTLNGIPGVVETGLFVNMATKIVVGYEDGRVEEVGS